MIITSYKTDTRTKSALLACVFVSVLLIIAIILLCFGGKSSINPADDPVTENSAQTLIEKGTDTPAPTSAQSPVPTAEPTLTPTPSPTPVPTPKHTPTPAPTPVPIPGLDYSAIASKSTKGAYYYVVDKGGKTSLSAEHINKIKKYGGIMQGNTSKKVIYLTFNMGDEHGYTPSTLEILKRHNVKATFFCLGDYVKNNPTLTAKIHNYGNLIANHGNHHIFTSDKSVEAAANNVKDFYTVVREKTGIVLTKKFYRPPSGHYSERDLEIARQLGDTPVFWSFTYADYKAAQEKTDEEILKLFKANLSNGAIYQLHLNNAGNTNVLEEFIIYAKSQGYTFDTVDNI